MVRSKMKSSRFLVYKVAPTDRALNASKQSFSRAGNLALRSGRVLRSFANMVPASFQWLWVGVKTRPAFSNGRNNTSTRFLPAGVRAPANNSWATTELKKIPAASLSYSSWRRGRVIPLWIRSMYRSVSIKCLATKRFFLFRLCPRLSPVI